MALNILCPKCGKAYRIAEESLGARAQCKNCSHTFTLSMSIEETTESRAIAPKRPATLVEQSEAGAGSKKSALKKAQPLGPPAKQPSAQPAGPVPSSGIGPSSTIGYYVVRQKLGSGGMGEVWLAHDPNLDRQVAIKVLPAAFSADEERLQRFLREARLAARLDHTNAVTVYQAGVEGNLAYIVMQYVDGGPLDDVVSSHGRMDWREATQVIRDAAAGLDAAHRIGLVHRDIKPANLMRTRQGETKVVDFGLARTQLGNTELTQQGVLLGTPAFMSPEQWMNRKVDGRSDLYSLVCTYYFLLTGRVPFDAQTLPSLGYQHRYEPLPDPRSLAPELPDAVCRILAHGTQKDPADRYQTATELVAELDALLATPQESLIFDSLWEEFADPAAGAAGATLVGKLTRGKLPRLTARWQRISRPLRRRLAPLAKRLRTPPGIAIASGAAATLLLLSVILYVATNYGTVKIELSDAAGNVEVKVDGDTIDIAGLDKPLRVKVGEHLLLVSSDEFGSVSQSFTVRRGREEVLRVSLEPPASEVAPPKPAGPGTAASPTRPPPTAGAPATPPGLPPVSPRQDPSSRLKIVVTTPPPDETPTGGQQATGSTSAPTTPLAQLPAMEVVSPSWTPSQDAKSTTIRKNRDSTLHGLTEHSWYYLLSARYDPGRVPPRIRSRPGSSQPQQSPLAERFVLTGRLAAVRVKDGKSVVYLRANDPNQPPVADPAYPFGYPSGSFCPAAAIELPTDQMAVWMADYKLGEQIRAVVKRQSRTKTPSPERPPFYPGDMPPMMAAHADELRPMFVEEGHSMQMCWCFLGEGLEKPNLPDTWIDPTLGRAGTLANAAAVGRCPGVLLRNAPGCRGTSGRLSAKLSRITRSKQGGGIVISLIVPDSAEGPIPVVAHFGSQVEVAELLDYQSGQLVELAATLVGPEDRLSQQPYPGGPAGPGGPPPGFFPVPPGYGGPPMPGKPLPFWRTIRVNCSQIQMQGDASTLVSTSGPRRNNVQLTTDTPDAAHADLNKVLGKEATWSGTLYRLRRQNGETHLAVSFTGSVTGLRHFEAFTTDKDFFDELADYVESSITSRADKVSVTGTIRNADAASFRLQTNVPLLEIKQLQREGESGSRAVVGRKRAAGTFRKSSVKTGLAALLRDWPPVGTEVKFTGDYYRYDSRDKDVEVRLSDRSGYLHDTKTIIRFPQSSQASFADYKSGDEVEVTAAVAAHADYLTLLGKSIVRSANPDSLVTDQGRATAAMDFSVEKEQWRTLKYKLKDNVGKKVHAWGYYGGFTRGPASYRITVKKLFSDYGDLTLDCNVNTQATQFLRQLKDGEEVFFEFAVEGGSSSKPVGKLLWIARMGEPDKKLTLAPAASE